MLHEALRQLAMAALHLQLRAGFQVERPPIRRAGATHEAAIDGQANLRAMSHFCVKHLMPPVHCLMGQVDAAARTAIALAEAGPDSDLAPGFKSLATGLEHARGASRGRDRTPRHNAGMIRLSEQRLWAALAVELQRLEGADGPMTRACAGAEAAAFALAEAVENFITQGEGLALAQRRDLAQLLLRLETQAARDTLSPEQVERQLGPLAARLPELADLVVQLSQEYRPLRETRPQIAKVLSIATRTAIQSGATERLEQVMQDLDRLLSALVLDYRGRARSLQVQAARQQLAAELPQWRGVTGLLAAPLALCDPPEADNRPLLRA